MNAVKKRPVFRGFVTFSISNPGLNFMTLGMTVTPWARVCHFYQESAFIFREYRV